MLEITHILHTLKRRTRTWEQEKNRVIMELQQITSDISNFGKSLEMENPSPWELKLLIALEDRNNEIMKIHEITW